MKYSLPSNSNYGEKGIPITFPSDWDVTISEFQGYHRRRLNNTELRNRIQSAYGMDPISTDAKGCSSAVIIIDDITRPTPCEAVSRIVIDELLSAGVPEENIWFVVALGSHGTMNREQFVKKIGEDLVERYGIYNHNAFFNHVFLGNTTHNVPVEINADVMSADYKIGIGTMMAHSYFGFSGGGKCIVPGVASIRTIMANHSYTTTSDFNMGNEHTLMRDDAMQAAEMMGLNCKIDVLLNGRAEICALYCGSLREEVPAAIADAREHYRATFVPDCDIVLSNNYFKPAEASCAYTPETIASLKPGGDYILSANSPYGQCVHFLYDSWGHSSPGGMDWSGCYEKSSTMGHAIVFSQYTNREARNAWYIDENSGALYEKSWNDVMDILDDGHPKKVVVYPNAECQILTNSNQFYTKR